MAEFESSGESIGHDPCSLQREEESRERLQEEPISPREVRGDRADEEIVTPAANWNGETREILRGLAEEAGGDAIAGEGAADEVGQGARLSGRRGGTQVARQRPTSRQLVRQRPSRPAFTLEQRLLILDAWRRSGLLASEFAPLVGIVSHTLRDWARAFEQGGPAGLAQKPRGARVGSRLPEATKRAILLLKQDHPEWGCQRISDVLLRGPGLGACASAVARVLHEAGYELEEVPTRTLPDAICPDGSPREGSPPCDDADPRPPGTSPLDDSLARVAAGLADPPPSGNHIESNAQPAPRGNEPPAHAAQGGGQ